MKTLLYIMSLCAAYIFLSVQFDVLAQSSSPAATRAYCDNNRNIAVQMTTQNLSTNLPIIVSQEVAKVSQSFVTNAYPVPVPVTNTVYVETVVSNQIIYQTTQTEVYATYAFTTNTYISITNIVTVTNTYSIGMSNIMQTANNESAFLFVGDVEERNTGASNVYQAIYHQASQSSGYGVRIGSFHEGLQQKSEYNGDYGISYTKMMGNYSYSLYYLVSPSFNSVYVGDDIYNKYVDTTIPASATSIFKGTTATNRVIAISNAKTIMGGSLYINGLNLYNIMADSEDYKIASVRDTIILSTAPEETRENGFKSYVGHNGNIIIDTAPVSSDSFSPQSNMCCSFSLSSSQVKQNIKGSIILRTQKGLNDIYIDETELYNISQVKKSLAQVIGQMITNVVNEMRPQ